MRTESEDCIKTQQEPTHCLLHCQTWLHVIAMIIFMVTSIVGYADLNKILSPLSTPSQCLACYNSALSNPERNLYFAHCQCYLQEYAADSDRNCERDRWWLQCSWDNTEVMSTDSTDFEVLWSNDTVYQRNDFGNFTKVNDTQYLVDDGGICTPLLDLPDRQSTGLWNSEAQKSMRFGLIWIHVLAVCWCWVLFISNRRVAIFWKLCAMIYTGWNVMFFLVDAYNPHEVLTDEIVCVEFSNPSWVDEMLKCIMAPILLASFCYCVSCGCWNSCTKVWIDPYLNTEDGEAWSYKYRPDRPIQFQELKNCMPDEKRFWTCFLSIIISWFCLCWSFFFCAVIITNAPVLTFVFATSFLVMILLFLEMAQPLSFFVSDLRRCFSTCCYTKQRTLYYFEQHDVDSDNAIQAGAGANSRHHDEDVEMAGTSEPGITNQSATKIATIDE